MGADPVSLGVMAAMTVASIGANVVAQRQQAKAAKNAAKKQKQAHDEEMAANAANMSMQQAQDDQARRQQVRENRKKRAIIAQAAENNGVGQSSGDIGGQAALNTDYYANTAFMNTVADRRMESQNHQQAAADFNFAAQKSIQTGNMRAANWQLFGAAMGAGADMWQTVKKGKGTQSQDYERVEINS